MADIVTPQAVKFANEKARRLADLLQTTRRTCEQFALDVTDFEVATDKDGDKDVIDDGAKTDGRKPVAKEQVAQLKFVAEQVAAALNQDDRAALVAAWVVNGQPIF